MQADVFTRVVLVLILGCLVALVARDFAGGDETPLAATRGRYSLTMARPGNFVLLRTDTHTGEVSRTYLKEEGPWEILGVEPVEVEVSEEQPAAERSEELPGSAESP
jgi:hypothetical protein